MENRSKTASLLTAESIMLGVRHEKEGKLRVTALEVAAERICQNRMRSLSPYDCFLQ